MNELERRVIDACLVEHAAHAAVQRTHHALVTRPESSALDHRRRLEQTALAATRARQAAVADLAASRSDQPKKEAP